MNTITQQGTIRVEGFTNPTRSSSGLVSPTTILNNLTFQQVWRQLNLNEVLTVLREHNYLTGFVDDYTTNVSTSGETLNILKPDGFLEHLYTFGLYDTAANVRRAPFRLTANPGRVKVLLRNTFDADKTTFLRNFAPERVFEFLNDEAVTSADDARINFQSLSWNNPPSDATYGAAKAKSLAQMHDTRYVASGNCILRWDSFAMPTTNWTDSEGIGVGFINPSLAVEIMRVENSGAKNIEFKQFAYFRYKRYDNSDQSHSLARRNGYFGFHDFDRKINGQWESPGGSGANFNHNSPSDMSMFGTSGFPSYFAYPNVYYDHLVEQVAPRVDKWFGEFYRASGNVDVVHFDLENPVLTLVPFDQGPLHGAIATDPNVGYGLHTSANSGTLNSLLGDQGQWIMNDDRWQNEQAPYPRCPIANISGMNSWSTSATTLDNRWQVFIGWAQEIYRIAANKAYFEPIKKWFPNAKFTIYDANLHGAHIFSLKQVNAAHGSFSGFSYAVGNMSSDTCYGSNITTSRLANVSGTAFGTINLDSVGGGSANTSAAWGNVSIIQRKVNNIKNASHLAYMPWLPAFSEAGDVNSKYWAYGNYIFSAFQAIETQKGDLPFYWYYSELQASGNHFIYSKLCDEYNNLAGYERAHFVEQWPLLGDPTFASNTASGVICAPYYIASKDVGGRLLHRYMPRPDMMSRFPFESNGHVYVDLPSQYGGLLQIPRATIVPWASGNYDAQPGSGTQIIFAPSGWWIEQFNRSGEEATNWSKSKWDTVKTIFPDYKISYSTGIAETSSRLEPPQARTGLNNQYVRINKVTKTFTLRKSDVRYVDYKTGKFVVNYQPDEQVFNAEDNFGTDNATTVGRTNTGQITVLEGSNIPITRDTPDKTN